MDLNIYNIEILEIHASADGTEPGIDMHRVELRLVRGNVTIWLSLEQAALLVAELEKLYPELSGEGQFDRAVDRWADEHAGELDQEHPDMPSMANAGLPVTINR